MVDGTWGVVGDAGLEALVLDHIVSDAMDKEEER